MSKKNATAELKPVWVSIAAALALALSAAPTNTASAQSIDFYYAAADQDRLDWFARRGVALDLTNVLPVVAIEPDNVSSEIFHESASPLLVATFDSLQPGTKMRSLLDRILTVSGGSLKSLIVVMVEDDEGMPDHSTGGIPAVTRGSHRYFWPATNLFGQLRTETTSTMSEVVGREITCTPPNCPERETVQITTVGEDSDMVRNLKSSLASEREAVAYLERVIEEAESRLPALVIDFEMAEVSISEQRKAVADLVPELEALEMNIEALKVQDQALATSNQLKANQRASLRRVGMEVPAVPDIPRLVDKIRRQREEAIKLGVEKAGAEGNLDTARRQLRVVRAQQERLQNLLINLNASLAEHQSVVRQLEELISDLESGTLDLTKIVQSDTLRSAVDTSWVYSADVILGSTIGSEIVDQNGHDLWWAVLVQRFLNTQIQTPYLIRAQKANEHQAAKTSWAEIAFFGSGFEASELVPSQRQAVENGLGIFLGAVHSRELFEDVQSFFSKTGLKYVWPLADEDTRQLNAALETSGTRTTEVYEHLSPLLQSEHRIGEVPVGRLDWWNVPASDLLKASSTTTGFLMMLFFGGMTRNTS